MLVPLPTTWPRMLRVRQLFATPPPLDLPAAIRDALRALNLEAVLPPAARVAVAVGSRGITHLLPITRAILERLKADGARPFVVTAMGSHGGATPEGQRRILADYGLTEATLDAPIRDATDVRSLGRTDEGTEVWCSEDALQADCILLVNRIKPHTDFGGAIGSGLLKMSVVGLGKHAGAQAFHRAAQRIGYETALRAMATVIRRHTPLLGGIAILEGPQHQTARIVGVPASQLEALEPSLVAEARRWMPRLPFDEIDLLIVDRIGKEISGTGMDPNVIGRSIHGYSLLEPEMPRHPRIRRIFVRDLTPATRGNATGIGMADFTTTRLVQSIDQRTTYTNALTAISLQGSKIPIHFPTDRDAVAAAINSLSLPEPAAARVVRIADTLSLTELKVSEACADEVRARPQELEILGGPADLTWDAKGDLE